MKRISLMLVSLWLMTSFVIAQTPQAFKYQAVARTSSGNLIQNQLVAFRITLLQGGPSGTLVYQERHTTNTNNYGLANLDIGNGTVLAGTFGLIDWSAGSMFIKVEFDPLGGIAYQDMGTTQLLSVPYAQYSITSEKISLPYYDTLSPSSGYVLSLVSNNSSCIHGVGTFGVMGKTNSTYSFGSGVSGSTSQTDGDYHGVEGTTNSTSGKGVYGLAYQTTGTTCGVYGETRSGMGYGVYGKAATSSGTNYGVYGEASSPSGCGVYGGATEATGINIGVSGESASTSGTGVLGKASAFSGIARGIYGQSNSSSGQGVFGNATSLSGSTSGVYGVSFSNAGYGVYGLGAYGSGTNYGVYGKTNSPNGYGVYGIADVAGGWANGVMGETASVSGNGVYGLSTSVSGATCGVVGEVNSPDGFSGYFQGGKVYISGNAGIGTMSPNQKLEINGQNSEKGLRVAWGPTYPTVYGEILHGGSGGFKLNAEASGGGWADMSFQTNGTTRMFIESIGNIGIGTTAPTQLLDVNGNARFRAIGSGAYTGPVNRTSDGTLTTATSDGRLKENVHTLQNSLDKVMQLRGVSFTWKSNPEMGKRIGFIAQEFEKVIPELVFTNAQDGYKGINYAEVSAVLVEAMKELKRENDRLKTENDNLNNRLERIEEQLNLSSQR